MRLRAGALASKAWSLLTMNITLAPALLVPCLSQRKQGAALPLPVLPRIFTIPPDLDAALGVVISGGLRPANGLVTY